MVKRKDHITDLFTIKKLLSAWGYSVLNITKAIKQFQKLRGLPETGIVGNRTFRALMQINTGMRICGFPDHIVVNNMAKWPFNTIRWNIDSKVPGLSLQEQKDAYIEALGYIEDVCGLRYEYSANVKNLSWVAKPLGGPGGVLGQTWLPINARVETDLINIEMDSGERWVIAEHPKNNEIDIVRVACHEAMHHAGLPHGGDSLMRPTYDPTIRKPGNWEIKELVKRYGPPRRKPQNDNTTINPDSLNRIVIKPGKYLLVANPS